MSQCRSFTLINAPRCVLISALLVYLSFSFAIAAVKTPWIDEGWVASAPVNWAYTGHFGSPSLEPTGSWLDASLTGIREYTYWNLPVGIAAQALWYKLLGFSFVKMRVLGILAGLIVIVAWFEIVKQLTASVWAGALTAVLLAVDYTFIWSAADGRMDMFCIACGSAGLATYLLLRRSLTPALHLSNVFVALSLFTHPNGILFMFALLLAFFWFDRGRFRPSFILAGWPYFVLAATWAAYISIRPDYFLAQFSANASAIGGTRWEGILHPLQAIRNEATRYLTHYGFFPLWTGPVPRYVAAVPLLFGASLLTASLLPAIRRHAHTRLLLIFAWTFLLFLTFFVGLKAQNYIAFVVPLYVSVLGATVALSHRQKRTWAPITALAAASLLFIDVSVLSGKIQANTFAHEYQPVVDHLRQRLQPGSIVFAGSQFGLSLGFNRVVDDARLGFYSGRDAAFVIEDNFSRYWWERIFKSREPAVATYIRNRLEGDYRLDMVSGPFRVYVRKSTDSQAHCVDTAIQWFSYNGDLLRTIQLSGLFGDPAIAPHATGLLLTKLKPGSSTLWYLNFETLRMQPLFEQEKHVSRPACALNADVCGVSLRRNNAAQVFRFAWPAGKLTRISHDDGTDLLEGWTADGSSLAFTQYKSNAGQSWQYSNGRLEPDLREGDLPVSETRFSPSGKHISFNMGDRQGQERRVYIAEANGSSPALNHLRDCKHSAEWLDEDTLACVNADGNLITPGKSIPVAGTTGYAIDLTRKEIIVVGVR